MRQALAAIDSPSAANRWLLKIEPGRYDVGDTVLALRDFVDVEGSGRLSTEIIGHGGTVVSTASTIELRELTVTCDAAACSAIQIPAEQSPRLRAWRRGQTVSRAAA